MGHSCLQYALAIGILHFCFSMGWKKPLGLSPYDDNAKSMRKLLHDGMSPKVMQASPDLSKVHFIINH